MIRLLALFLLALLPASALAADIVAPSWAYHPIAPAAPRPRDDDTPQHVPGSDQTFTAREAGNAFGMKDWFPNEHPPMPETVQNGRRPDVRACALCHLTNGMGHPASSDVAGLSAEYFFRQMKDFQNGTRQNIVPERSLGMVTIAKAMTDDEIRAAAAYYASLRPRPWVTVKETDTVPAGAKSEPLGQRIVEVPEDPALSDLFDPHSGFIAYVPKGSIEKGKLLAAPGANGAMRACAACHGADLKGAAPAPRIAGSHPTYIARQLLDMQQGSRSAPENAAMKPVVAKLSLDDIIALAAYAGSLSP